MPFFPISSILIEYIIKTLKLTPQQFRDCSLRVEFELPIHSLEIRKEFIILEKIFLLEARVRVAAIAFVFFFLSVFGFCLVWEGKEGNEPFGGRVCDRD